MPVPGPNMIRKGHARNSVGPLCLGGLLRPGQTRSPLILDAAGNIPDIASMQNFGSTLVWPQDGARRAVGLTSMVLLDAYSNNMLRQCEAPMPKAAQINIGRAGKP